MAFTMAEGVKSLITAHTAISGWQVEIGAMPEKPDRVIMITDTGGMSPNPKWLLDFPTVQVMVRGGVNDYKAIYNECKTLRDILLGLEPVDVNGDRWVSVTMEGDMLFVGRDQNTRPMFSSNYRLIIEPQVSAETNRTAL